jgi:hypothetical protein
MTTYTPEQRDRASMNALLALIELKQEQLRQLRVYEPRRLTFQLLTAVATVLGAGGAFVAAAIALAVFLAKGLH